MSDKLLRNRIRCRLCGDIIESMHRHDFRWCSCGAVAVDGGTDYAKRVGDGWEDLSQYETDYDDAAAIALADLKPTRRRPRHYIHGDDIAREMRWATDEAVSEFFVPKWEWQVIAETLGEIDPAAERSGHADDYRRALAVLRMMADDGDNAARALVIRTLEAAIANFLELAREQNPQA